MTLLTERDGTLWWNERIAFIPSLHGRAAFAGETRRVFLNERFPTVAVELPESLASQTCEGVEQLPVIHVVSYEEEGGTRCFFPIDPCDSIVEAIRLGIREHCSLEFIDCDVTNFERRTATLPDPYAVRSIRLSRYYQTVASSLPPTEPDSLDDHREQFMALRLHQLAQHDDRHLPVLCVLGITHLKGVVRYLDGLVSAAPDALDAERVELLQSLPPFQIDLHPISEDSLYHILGELPYITHLWEQERHAITLDEFDGAEQLKLLLLRARERFHRRHTEEYEQISTVSFQNLLKLVRNLCLLESRLTPSLYEMVLAARGIGGDGFAVEVLRTAREYPAAPTQGNGPSPDDEVQPVEPAPPTSPFSPVEDGFEPGGLPGPVDMTENAMQITSDVVPAKKRYLDEDKEWKTLRLERPPSKQEKAKWRTAWNPYETCSWEPEDRLVENFAGHVRSRALFECGVAQERIEEFTTSFKDGLHVRETLRSYHLGKIFVREVPMVTGQVGAVVIIYEEPSEDKFPWKLTWFSEHEWESTLSFYATDYHKELVGPGIGQSLYGGQLFLYPPRFIIDVWQDDGFDATHDDAERLVFAGLFHTREKFVAYVAAQPPTLRMKAYAERLGRRILYLPLSSFSRSTLQKLRCFHVLNGKPVRSYAQQFIR